MKINETFVDGVGNIAVHAALARIELMQIERLPAAGEKPSYQLAERLVMGIDTLLRLHQALNEIVQQMESRGLVKPPAGEPK